MKKLSLLGLLLAGALVYNYIEISQPKIRNLDLDWDLEGQLRISQLSDFHNNGLVDLAKLEGELDKFQPDLIVLTGDMIDRRSQDLASLEELLDRLVLISRPIYFVRGNHEHASPLQGELEEALRSRGIEILDNESRRLDIRGMEIDLLGLDFYHKSEDYARLEAGLEGGDYRILLSHSPNRLLQLENPLEDLVLAGHTHGGQVRLPLVGALVAPGQGYLPQYDKGLFYLNGRYIYIDSGLGNSGLPLRFLNRIQISNIVLTKGEG